MKNIAQKIILFISIPCILTLTYSWTYASKLSKNEATTPSSDIVQFSVQVGVYKKQIPTDVLNLFLKIGNVKQREIDNGFICYMSGEFKTYEAADRYKKMLAADKGIQNAPIIVLHKSVVYNCTKHQKCKKEI